MNETQEDSVGALVRRLESNFTSGTTLKSKYVSESLHEDISRIDAYLNSKHTSGIEDSMGREKPFFNIVIAAKNIWFRATDLDRKNIKVRADKAEDTLVAFAGTQMLQNWMKKENFGQFLNNWGLDLASYNESVVKFVEQEGKLHAMTVPWNRLICDSINFEQNPVIELLEMTPAQLRNHPGYDQEIVEELIDSVSARKTVDGLNKDNLSDYIKLYEVHGELPLSMITGKDKDDDTYVQQMHVVSFVGGNKGKYDDFTLVKGKEEKSPYMLTALLPETDGSISLKGSVKTLFDAQWMMNHTQKAIKDQLDLASKLIFQTSDGNFVGQNALSAIESGDILIHAPNEPLTQLANNSHDITSLQNFGTQWQSLAQNIASTPDALMGNNAPSGTAWRQVEALQNEAHSLFELMTENKGLCLEKMLRTYVIPFIKKTALNNTKQLVAMLEGHDLTKIDAKHVKREATKKTNKEIVDQAIKYLSGEGEAPTPETQALAQAKNEQEVQANLDEAGNTRFFVPSEVTDMTWKKLFEDLEWNLDIDVTGESAFNKEDLATLSTVLQTIGANPMILQDPNAKLLFNKILTLTGTVSPIEIQSVPKQTPQPLPAPVGGQATPGGLPA